MRIAFMGTPEFAVPALDALVAAGHDIAAVYTQPPRPAGRGKKLMPSAVQLRAQELGLAVYAPVSLRTEDAQSQFLKLDLDLAVVAAYGLILPQPILDAPKQGCLNVHGSLLPRWRGAAPVQRAILAGDLQTGVMVMQMDAGLDTGAVRAAATTPIGAKTCGELTGELANLGAQLMASVIADLAAYPPVAQPDAGATYAGKIDKAETRLDFSVSAEQAERQVRAFNPVPGAWFEFAGERYRVLEAQAVLLPSSEGDEPLPGTVVEDNLTITCGTGAIRPTIIQRAGKPAMAITEFLRGNAIPAGTRLI
jgi:methionyl-tRNA formyltransferase